MDPGCGQIARKTSRREPGSEETAWLRLFAIGLAIATIWPLHAQTVSPKSRLIVGRVVEATTGQPVSAAEVILRSAMVDERNGRPVFQWMPRILTSSDGYFVFRDLTGDKFHIVATKRGYAEGAYGRRHPSGAAATVALEEGERIGELVIKLWKHAAISGTVTDEAGEPLVAVQVRALRKSLTIGKARFVVASTTVTDDRGIYRLSTLIPGEFVIVTSSRQVAVPLSMAHEANTATASLISSVGGPNSLPGTSTAIQTSDTMFSLGRGTPIPAPTGDGRLFVYPPTFHPSSDGLAEASTITLSAGEERAGIDLRLQPVPTVRVSGSIFMPDAGGLGVPLRLRPAGAADLTLEQDWPVAIRDASGRFTFPAVPAGDYTLRVATSRQPLYWTEVPISVGRRDVDGITVSLQPGSRISGRVVFDGQSTAPPTNRLGPVAIVVESADNSWTMSSPGSRISGRVAFEGPAVAPPESADNSWSIPGRGSAITFDSTGQFTTDGLPGGRYFVRVSGSPPGWMFKSAMHNGRDLSEVPVELHNADVAGVVLTFTDRWTSLSGVVQRPQGAAPGADIEATVLVFPLDPEAWGDAAPNPRRIRSTTTRKNGEFNFSSLPAGDYYAIAVADDYGADWRQPAFMQTLARVATRVTVGDGEHKKQDLRIVDVR